MSTENLIYMLVGVLDGAGLAYCISGLLEVRRSMRRAAELKALAEQ